MSDRGYSVLGALVGLVVVVALGFIGYLVFSHSNKTVPATTPVVSVPTNQPAASVSNAYTSLPPASVSSKTAECNQQISYSSNGVPGPIQCSNGDLNSTDWKALAALEPLALSLGYTASAAAVQAALCSDVQQNISNPIEESVYQIAALYYGWNFNPSPSLVLTNGTCKNVDD